MCWDASITYMVHELHREMCKAIEKDERWKMVRVFLLLDDVPFKI